MTLDAELSRDNVALYSFTTSNDKKVLQYIANPAQLIEDQHRLSLLIQQLRNSGAHFLLLNEAGGKRTTDARSDMDMNDDESVTRRFPAFYDM